MSDYDWTEVGAADVRDRAKFLTRLTEARWEPPTGSKPMSPALGLTAVIREFGIRPVTAVTYNAVWKRYQILGVRTRKQALWFLDKGSGITPVLIETLPVGAAV